uniref:Uncharacterized protein n=1 Tax=virus sp. ctiha2 TaxID=2827299 RepID=A0A8S5RGH6_9VIRU|nr:MAG TPA: hypothetical protein [virus sp. ctiha2]DAX97712.1 MAG TPA: hypothetical protein [Caudoviricetes sp.]
MIVYSVISSRIMSLIKPYVLQSVCIKQCKVFVTVGAN